MADLAELGDDLADPAHLFDGDPAKGQLLAGVHAIDEERAVEMMSGNEEFRRGPDGRFMTVDDAALSLRQRVEVKAHTRFEWSIVQQEAIRRFVVLGSKR